ncbi:MULTISPECIES: ATP/GTP-binding protein [unclassified Streptomyces]|uniref:ATP/GTP-binding protein n=1 Tax=unclassified Streptomyces TaxID=2593676 RepID=UPI002DD8F84A|nr:ATP/GTP-binding protein [Streptomyces sp. NBC_01795]WSA97749.1 type IV secretory system conjugative DNA transfer family protein [Streptomyces sp. NBC_01795]WSS46734.1 type IV secretory system conjugative DNA transfer family protein [Streptomyces sp. NBC_01187]WSS47049.1 type IV secretory system conjugative DNA transfer family protein [Streptomyces sp. NBC_01187]
MSDLLFSLIEVSASTAGWIYQHALVLTLAAAVLLAGAETVLTRLARIAIRKRTRFRLVPARNFDPEPEELWRSAMQWSAAASAGPWWAPRRARTLRTCLRADGTTKRALDFYVEAPSAARHLLTTSAMAGVQVEPAPKQVSKELPHVVRAEFTIRGPQVARLREVPLVPDPLQPLVDAVGTLRTELGESVELCVDLQPVPPWQLRLRRGQRIAEARAFARRQAERDSRQAALASLSEDSFRAEFADFMHGDGGPSRRRVALPAKAQPVDRAKTLGKLAEGTGLVRVQILARCTAAHAGRAEQRMRHIGAALQVFAGDVRLTQRGRQVGPWRLDANHRWLRSAFDSRWSSGLMTASRSAWLHATEIAGLLKPPTRHCRMPLRQRDLPVYALGVPGLMPHGWYRGPDGRERLIATRLEETLVSVRSGKTAYGKTTQALTQMVALAHDGGGAGGLFVDPHGDAMRDVAPFLAHPHIGKRLWYLDLTGPGTNPRIGSWNTLGVERGQDPEQVAHAVVDAFADVLGWADATHPRALTLMTKAAEALVRLNTTLVREGKEQAQATLFQVEPLLTDAAWRQKVLSAAGMDEEAVRWWRTIFPTIPPDAYATVLNPIERLGRRSTIRAFLGRPTSSYHLREAMDEGLLVWVCPSATGPTDRLVLSLLFHDLYRTGLARRDTPSNQRRPFHTFIDELLAIDGAVGLLASVSEQLRKFGIRLHGMTQLLQRLNGSTRQSMLQNASVISSTAASFEAAVVVAREWDGAVEPSDLAALDRFEHFISLTHQGRQVGPLRIRGPRPEEIFADVARPQDVGQLRQAADANLKAAPVRDVLAAVGEHTAAVADAVRAGPAQPPGEGGSTVEPELT